MRTLDPTIKLRDVIADQIFMSLQGNVTDTIRRNHEGYTMDAAQRNRLDAQSVKVNKDIMGDYYRMCMDVKEKLGFEGDIDFYITNSSEVNCMSYASEFPENPSIVEINSELYNLLDLEELSFVIGHEIGHLINRDSVVTKLYTFVYPYQEDGSVNERCPIFLERRFQLFCQLGELSADRFGYMACENLNACITANFKMGMGIKLNREELSIDALLEENDRRLNFFLEGNGDAGDTHPVDPIRLRALELFAAAKTQKALNEGMDALIELLQSFTYGEMDYLRAQFIASAGLVMSYADGKKEKQEVSVILEYLGKYSIFPNKILKDVEKNDPEAIMKDSIEKIIANDSECRLDLMDFLIDIAFADHNITESEVDKIYEIGELLGYEPVEVTNILAESMADFLIPKTDVLG